MDGLTRLFPFLWPHRRRLLLSAAFGLLVAVLWSANLSVAFPVVKVLLNRQDLHEYVNAGINESEVTIADKESYLLDLEERISTLESQRPANDPELLDQLQKRLDNAQKLTDARRTHLAMTWVKCYLMPWIPHDRFQTFALIMTALLVATLLKGVFIFIQDVLVGSIVELVMMSIRKQCFRRVLSLDYQTLAADGTADLMSRFTFDMQQMATGLELLGGKLVREPMKAVACIACALLINWQLTLLSMIFVPVMGYFFYRYGKMLKRASQRMMESMSRIYKVLEETFDGLKVVIAFEGAPRHRRQFHAEHKEYYDKAMRVVRIDALTKPTTEMLGLLAVFVAMLPGAYLVLTGATTVWGVRLSSSPVSPERLAVLYAMLAGVLDPCRKLSSVYSRLKRSTAAIDRVFSLVDRRSVVVNPENPLAFPPHRSCIEFHEVSYQYPARKRSSVRRPALEKVRLRIDHGEVIALVGENGSGKSTLVNLLPRFFDPQHGAVHIDGIPIREVSLRDLRQQIGLVTQETILFDDTLYENIRYGKFNATREEVEAAADKAHVTSFLRDLPERFETRVGEKGRELSGGQRQRIALARAILRDPSILILDEATSAIDAQSESLIHEALRKFVRGRTVLMVTHSLSPSVLDLASRIVVMDDGRVAATGTHEQLMLSCPGYVRLFEARSRRQAA